MVIIFLKICFLSFALAAARANPRVHTNVGVIEGLSTNATFNGVHKPVLQFLGIPFAEAPVGHLRFSKPVPKSPFTTAYNATSLGPACPQNTYLSGDKSLNSTIAEDCLRLNIYVPGATTSVTKLPVMVWIYGGGFVFGASHYYDASVLSTFNDVIVVTLNYRLSVFGFLSTGDSSSRGNYGLWDQHVAIKWVHDNIAAFGGDAGKLTIFGESAGSASVFYQATFPGNKNLFQKAIGESGTTLAPWAFSDFGNTSTWRHNLEYFANKVGCDVSRSEPFVACLRNLPFETIMTALSVDELFLELSFRFTPVVDGEFVKVSPQTVFTGKDVSSIEPLEMFKSVDVMTGVNSMDGASTVVSTWNLVVQQYTHTSIDDGCPRQVFENVIVPAVTKGLFGKDLPAVDAVIKFEYTDWTDPDNANKTRSRLIDLSSDYTFFVPAIRAANKHSEINLNNNIANTSNTYFYQFSHRPSYDRNADWVTGATHATELGFVFGFPDSLARAVGATYIPTTVAERELSGEMMTLWTNFAKTGDPNIPVQVPSTYWPKYDTANRKYMDLDLGLSRSSVKQQLTSGRYAFWEYLIPNVVNMTVT